MPIIDLKNVHSPWTLKAKASEKWCFLRRFFFFGGLFLEAFRWYKIGPYDRYTWSYGAPINGDFLKWWYPTTMGFLTKNDHFGVFWGYHHLRKHPSSRKRPTHKGSTSYVDEGCGFQVWRAFHWRGTGGSKLACQKPAANGTCPKCRYITNPNIALLRGNPYICIVRFPQKNW